MIKIELVEEATEEAKQLVEELEEELARHYPKEQRHGLSLDALFQPHIRFFIAWQDETPVGCGGVALFGDFAEVKRMYVREGARGQGIAEGILQRLEEETRKTGLDTMRLETGTEQAAAMRFYRRCGFEDCEAFEPYASMPANAVVTSVFMEKTLSR